MLEQAGMQREDIDPDVVHRAFIRYTGLVQVAHEYRRPDVAMAAYEKAAALPSTATVQAFQKEGLRVIELP
jgi:hypothetical protein